MQADRTAVAALLITVPFLELILPGASLAAPLSTNDTIVVTATGVATPRHQIGNAVTVIDAAQIERRQYRNLSQALRSVPGVRVVPAGGPGQQTSVFMRGASSSHTLVLIDGVDAADPSSPSRAVDFANFPLTNVERIEVVRGPQSTLYGSNAIGGVINIITRRGDGETDAALKMELGNHGTGNQFLNVGGGDYRASWSLGASHQKTHADSVTPRRLREGLPAESDSTRNYALSSRLDLELTDISTLSMTANVIDGSSEFDPEVGPFDPGAFSFFTVEDPDAVVDTRAWFAKAESVTSLWQGRWDLTLAFAYTHYERATDNDRQDPARTLERVHFFGEKTEVSIKNDLYLDEMHTLSLGVGLEEEDSDASGFREFPAPPFSPFVLSEDSSAQAETRYAYLQDQISIGERVFTTLGVRVDEHDDFDEEVTWRITSAYLRPDGGGRFSASIGTGFRAPSLFELYGFTPNNFGSAYRGNPQLDPETSFGWDIGFEQPLGEQTVLGLSYFRNHIEDLIQLVTDPATFDQTSANVDEVDIQGVEAYLDFNPREDLQVQLTYTYQDIDQQDTSSDTEVVRRPAHSAALDINYRLNPRLEGFVGVDYIGRRKDVIRAFDSANTERVDSYTTARAGLGYRWSDDWRLFGRIENLGDERYEPADGFQAVGRWVLVGAEVSL